MPRPAKGARLWLEPASGTRRATWVIRDGSNKVRTGCARDDRGKAEQRLAEYIASKYQIVRSKRHPSEILVLDVLNLYLAEAAPRHARPAETKQRIMALADFFHSDTLAQLNGPRCRAYVASRVGRPWKSARPKPNRPARLVTEAAARRELEDLRAAVNYHRTEGYCSEIVSVALPAKAQSRIVWLTRSEVARMIWAAWRAKARVPRTNTERDIGKHIARFMLVGVYTGTRHAAICGAAFSPAIGRGHVDLDEGVFHRRAEGQRETKKRQPPVRLADRLLAHLRRWHRLGLATHAVVEWNGKPVESVRKGFASAVAAAGIVGKHVTPHALRHTAATWLMQQGSDMWGAAGLLGMTVQMLEQTYGHHHPDFQADAAAALAGQKRDRNTVNEQRRTSATVTKIDGFTKATG